MPFEENQKDKLTNKKSEVLSFNVYNGVSEWTNHAQGIILKYAIVYLNFLNGFVLQDQVYFPIFQFNFEYLYTMYICI